MKKTLLSIALVASSLFTASVATAAPVGWWSWIAGTMPDDAEAGGGLMVAVVQLAIALGATAGGVLFDAAGHRSTFAVSSLLLLLAAGLTVLTARTTRRRPA